MASALPEPLDRLAAEAFSPLGETPLVAIDLSARGAERDAARLARDTSAIVIGVDRAGTMPAIDPEPFDCLLTTAAEPARAWAGVASGRLDRIVAALGDAVREMPLAASVLARVLRINAGLPLRSALTIESLAYSTLLGGAAFRAWRATHPPQARNVTDRPLIVEREGDRVTVTFANAATRNAMCAAMRDALFEALAGVLDDPSGPALLLRGAGACFSVGGDLAEFGSATDLAFAHAIRTQRSCALLLDALGARATVELHGACIGSAIEIAAAAARRIAAPDTFFQLPELRMGLIPGAGGTATVARAIGRHRTCFMALSGRRMRARAALAWGLIDAIGSS